MINVVCSRCGFRSDSYRGFYCPVCGSLLSIDYSPRYRVDESKHGIWRYGSILPPVKHQVSLGEASTPLIDSSRLFREVIVYFKDEGRNPTGSFRDRAAALIVSDALDLGVKRLILASDGNMGASIAAYGARSGLPVTVYVPSWTDQEKIVLMKAYGANVLIHDKSLDDLLGVVEHRSRSGYYNASSTYNILSIHGLKTIAYEITLQMNHGIREVVLPLGSGLTLLSLYTGFEEMLREGLINRVPRLIGVETCGNPLYSSVIKGISRCGEEPLPGLSYSKPLIMDDVVRIIEKHGDVVVVNRRSVVEAARLLARSEGLFVEPSSAVALAGALSIGLSDYTIVLLTGHGLKGPSTYTKPSRARSTVLFPGSTKKLIIDLLREHPGLTGYDVWRMLGLKISVQAVYQHLHELVEKGYLEVRVEDGLKRYYLKNT